MSCCIKTTSKRVKGDNCGSYSCFRDSNNYFESKTTILNIIKEDVEKKDKKNDKKKERNR